MHTNAQDSARLTLSVGTWGQGRPLVKERAHCMPPLLPVRRHRLVPAPVRYYWLIPTRHQAWVQNYIQKTKANGHWPHLYEVLRNWGPESLFVNKRRLLSWVCEDTHPDQDLGHGQQRLHRPWWMSSPANTRKGEAGACPDSWWPGPATWREG